MASMRELNIKASFTFAKNHHDDPLDKTFRQIFCELMTQSNVSESLMYKEKEEFLDGVCCITFDVKLTQHFIKRTSYQQSNVVL